MSSDADHTPFSNETPSPEDLLRSIVDSSDDAIISKDLTGVVTSWNRSAERMFGYTAEEMIGRPITILIPPERNSEEVEILRKIRAGERLDHFETVRRHKDGRLIDVAVSISPVRSASGHIVGAAKIARDISETKRATSADLLLSAIVSSSDDAVISKNLEGIVTSWNAGAERIFGYKAEEMIGESILKLIPIDRKEEEPKILERLRRGERVEHFETVRVRKNGEKLNISLTISPVKNAVGKIVGASKIARDITELKRIAREREILLESERIARAQAEHANRMKDEFLATVSHELRTPLNAIVGWTEVLATGGQDRDEVIQGVDVIKRNAMMQAQLIEDLLDLGRITSGKMTLRIELVDPAAIVSEAIASVQHSAEAKQITLKTALNPLRGEIMGDAKRLQQIIWNLLANAIKFTDDGGHVLVTIAQAGSHLEIAVADNGRGIAPQFLPHLFERFSQADASTTRQHGGLGIGLALVKQLVELHGGTIRADSPGIGHGATFTLSLPVSVAVSASLTSPPETAAPDGPLLTDLSGLKVLAIDDDTDSVEVAKRILSARGAQVRTANSVAGAMEVLESFTPDVILSDIGMPRHDGYEFIRRLRERPAFSGIPAVAFTALARAEDRTRALNAGFQSHIAKPLAAAELVAVVRSFGKLRVARNLEFPAPRP
jgi:PAS domain S-box-containing protein